MYTKSQKIANFGLTCIPEKGRGFVTVRAVTANLVSKDARDLKEKSHETARRDLLALRTYRAKCLGEGGIRPSLFRVKIKSVYIYFKDYFLQNKNSLASTCRR